MASIEFEQNKDLNKNFTRIQTDTAGSAFARFLIKKGYAENIEQTNIILLAISAVSFILMLFIMYFFVFGAPLPSFSSSSNNNAKIIKEYRDQGLKGMELMKKIKAAREAGILK